jgi:hypothetical protein
VCTTCSTKCALVIFIILPSTIGFYDEREPPPMTTLTSSAESLSNYSESNSALLAARRCAGARLHGGK